MHAVKKKALVEEQGCVLAKDTAGCVLAKDQAGCVLAKDEAGCVLAKDKNGCVLAKDEAAGCVLAKDAAGCVLAKDEAGCVLAKHQDGCVLAKDVAGCVLATDRQAANDAGCVLALDGASDPVAVYRARLAGWDMSRVKAQGVRKAIFTADEIDAVEAEYKEFLAISCANVSGAITVTTRVDEFWHAHILFTQDYAKMCHAVAGQFLHHRPNILDEAAA